MEDFRSIIVKKEGTKKLVINNPTQFDLIGQGAQGAVFRLSEDRCVKIYAQENYRIAESNALKTAEESKIVPKIHEVGANYIVMDYIKGPPLGNYLRTVNFLPVSITKQLLFVLQEMERIGFKKIDCSLRHLLLTDQGELKLIDHVHSINKERAVPVDLFKGLSKLKLLDQFLYQVKELDPNQFSKWMDGLFTIFKNIR
ncbi:serine/threonine protein kinase [Neobacillus ginsengisoli]|uniref:Ser/Thr protein kinase n=1 Tax=Neobacillus ginsengisoli TaxID=904295 RepID=A0ABT9XZ11_9BACI|nr:serine/threonine protein kinase [Neobacillus ginsengisoli]MDQ0200810.1 putative Ser/Thr protein kinase [Neobacillus ginsengisoli]